MVKINTFECKVLYIFLKKVRVTEGRTTLTAPGQSFETMLSQCLTFITLDNLESTVLLGWQSPGHVLPPPTSENNSAEWGHVEPARWLLFDLRMNPWAVLGNIAWHLLFFFFFTESAHPVRDFIALGNPLATVSNTASHWLTELMRTSDTAVMAFQISSPAESKQCTGVVFFLTCQWSYSQELQTLCLVLPQSNWSIKRWNCEGPKCPTNVGISSR